MARPKRDQVLTLTLSAEEMDAVAELARRQGMSKATLARSAIFRYLEAEGVRLGRQGQGRRRSK